MDRTILVHQKSIYGQNMLYVHTDIEAEAIRTLTGKKTIDQRDIDALYLLGFSVVFCSENGVILNVPRP